MAIKRGKEKVANSIPEKLSELLLQGFSFQAIRDKYDEAFKISKEGITGYLEENSDGFTVEMSKGFTCDQGTVIYQSRNNFKFDNDRIIELVESGKLSLATLVNIASFNAEKLKTAIGEPEFEALATNNPTEFLTLRGSAEFKASVETTFADLMPKTEEPVIEEEKPKKKSVAEISAAVKKASRVKVIGPDEELSSILKKAKK